MSQAVLHYFDSQQRCNKALAKTLLDCVEQRLAAFDSASVLLPGGSTPAGLLHCLKQLPVPWSQLQISATDERWVALDSAQSNTQMLRLALPSVQLLEPRLADTAQGASEAWGQALQAHKPFAASLLGMGDDGHIASLFPGMPGLAAGLDLSANADALVGLAANEPRVRLSLNLSMLCASQWLGVLLFGEAKRRMLDRVLVNDPTTQALPIYHLLWQAPLPVHIYWAP
ncbi:MAG: 6-phosphogluconolactonase [Pseudomonas sp.]|jgi:6-phosphogluconolactonase|nr:6-phosphogluconolactonase [Pseudomonas sp.]